MFQSDFEIFMSSSAELRALRPLVALLGILICIFGMTVPTTPLEVEAS